MINNIGISSTGTVQKQETNTNFTGSQKQDDKPKGSFKLPGGAAVALALMAAVSPMKSHAEGEDASMVVMAPGTPTFIEDESTEESTKITKEVKTPNGREIEGIFQEEPFVLKVVDKNPDEATVQGIMSGRVIDCNIKSDKLDCTFGKDKFAGTFKNDGDKFELKGKLNGSKEISYKDGKLHVEEDDAFAALVVFAIGLAVAGKFIFGSELSKKQKLSQQSQKNIDAVDDFVKSSSTKKTDKK